MEDGVMLSNLNKGQFPCPPLLRPDSQLHSQLQFHIFKLSRCSFLRKISFAHVLYMFMSPVTNLNMDPPRHIYEASTPQLGECLCCQALSTMHIRGKAWSSTLCKQHQPCKASGCKQKSEQKASAPRIIEAEKEKSSPLLSAPEPLLGIIFVGRIWVKLFHLPFRGRKW